MDDNKTLTFRDIWAIHTLSTLDFSQPDAITLLIKAVSFLFPHLSLDEIMNLPWEEFTSMVQGRIKELNASLTLVSDNPFSATTIAFLQDEGEAN